MLFCLSKSWYITLRGIEAKSTLVYMFGEVAGNA